MKKLLKILVVALLIANPATVSAAEISPSPTPVAETVNNENDFTEEEKSMLLDSVQTIRAILVFIVFVIVFVAIIKFLSWFF